MVRARDILEPTPSVGRDASVLDAARLVAESHAPGVVVLDERGGVRAVLPASQVMQLFVPRYVRDDPVLARVWDERHADHLAAELQSTTMEDALGERPPPPVLEPDDTLIEAAAIMAQARTPLVPVVADGRVIGVVTAQRVLAAVLGP